MDCERLMQQTMGAPIQQRAQVHTFKNYDELKHHAQRAFIAAGPETVR